MRPEELQTVVNALRELGLTYDETVKLMSGVTMHACTVPRCADFALFPSGLLQFLEELVSCSFFVDLRF